VATSCTPAVWPKARRWCGIPEHPDVARPCSSETGGHGTQPVLNHLHIGLARGPGRDGTTVVLWGSAFVAIRSALPSLGFESVVSGRLLLAAGIFAILARPLGVRRPARAELPLLAAIGATGLFGYQTLLSAGEERVPAGISALIFAAAPVLVLLLARPLLGERLNPTALRRCGARGIRRGAVASTQGLAQGGDLGGSLLVLRSAATHLG
jgi:EamA-like transporter family